ncbi:hypothetical protein FM036_30255 [Nostoc sp. HG1]|nr:hypothetical protein [Nostoc sp. HG1]MCL6750111.1 hypothetical protein [Nostoc sp. CCCryo 231-06]
MINHEAMPTGGCAYAPYPLRKLRSDRSFPRLYLGIKKPEASISYCPRSCFILAGDRTSEKEWYYLSQHSV